MSVIRVEVGDEAENAVHDAPTERPSHAEVAPGVRSLETSQSVLTHDLSVHDALPAHESAQYGVLNTAFDGLTGAAIRPTDQEALQSKNARVRINYNGTEHEVSIQQAVDLGYVEKDVDGYLQAGKGHIDIESAQPQQQQEQDETLPMTDRTEGDMQAIREALPETMVDGIINAAASGRLVNDAGEIDLSPIRSELEHMAADTGASYDSLSASFGHMLQSAQQTVDAYATKQGITDPAGLWAWAKANMPQAVNNAITIYAHNRSVSGFKHIIDQAVAKSRATADTGTAGDLININGMVTTRAAAKAAGLI